MVSGRPSNRRRYIGLRGAIEILGRNWRIILDARHPTGMDDGQLLSRQIGNVLPTVSRLPGTTYRLGVRRKAGLCRKTCQQQGGYIVLLNLRFSSDLRFDIAGPESFRMTSQILSRLLSRS